MFHSILKSRKFIIPKRISVSIFSKSYFPERLLTYHLINIFQQFVFLFLFLVKNDRVNLALFIVINNIQIYVDGIFKPKYSGHEK